jgi:hypothetical protein
MRKLEIVPGILLVVTALIAFTLGRHSVTPPVHSCWDGNVLNGWHQVPCSQLPADERG